MRTKKDKRSTSKPLHLTEKFTRAGDYARQVHVENRKGIAHLHHASPVLPSGAVTDLTAEDAAVRMRSMTHQSFRTVVENLHRDLGLKSEVRSVFGTSRDGTEDAIMVTCSGVKNFDRVRYAAVLQGKLANQWGVIAFLEGAGKDSRYSFIVPIKTEGMTANVTAGTRIADIARNLAAEGIEYHTINPVKGGHEVVVIDQGTKLADNVSRAADRFGVSSVEQQMGNTSLPAQYSAKLPKENIYDLTADPESLRAKAILVPPHANHTYAALESGSGRHPVAVRPAHSCRWCGSLCGSSFESSVAASF